MWYIHSQDYVSTSDAFIDGHVITISPQVSAQVEKVYVLENQYVTKGTLLVRLNPSNFLASLDQARGQLLAARAIEGQNKSSLQLTRRTAGAAVSEGQAGVKIADAQITAAQTSVATAKSQLAQAKAQIAAARAGVAQAQAEVVADQAESRKTAADYGRYKKLLKTGDVTPQQVDSERAAAASAAAYLQAAKTAVTASRAKVTEAQAGEQAARQAVLSAGATVLEAQARLARANALLASVNVAPQKISVSEHRVSTAAARIVELQAAAQQAQINYGYTKIYAPCSGWVTRKTVEPGDYVQTGQALMAIVPRMMWVTANFKETDLTHMKKNQPVSISIDAYPNHTYHGKVASIQAGTGAKFSLLPPENATGNYVKVVQRVPVKIYFNKLPDRKLAPGMSVEPEVRIH